MPSHLNHNLCKIFSDWVLEALALQTDRVTSSYYVPSMYSNIYNSIYIPLQQPQAVRGCVPNTVLMCAITIESQQLERLNASTSWTTMRNFILLSTFSALFLSFIAVGAQNVRFYFIFSRYFAHSSSSDTYSWNILYRQQCSFFCWR